MTRPGRAEPPSTRRLDRRNDSAAVFDDQTGQAGPMVSRVRPARDADLIAIQRIYAHHVQTGTGSFEEVAPSLAEMTERRAAILARGLPYLVIEDDGTVAGFAYAALFRPRSAYRFTVEDSIYIDPDRIGRGMGHLLLAAIIDACTTLDYRQMVAVIGDASNAASIGLHASFGFGEAGRLSAAGYKFGRWLDVIFMQLTLLPSSAR